MKSSQKHNFLKVHNSKILQVYVYKCIIITIGIFWTSDESAIRRFYLIYWETLEMHHFYLSKILYFFN